MSFGSWKLVLSSSLIPYIISATSSSLTYWIHFSMMVHLPGLNTRSSLKGFISFMAHKSCHQRVKDYVPSVTAFSVPLSLERYPSCLASLPMKSKLLALPTQEQCSQVAWCSPGQRLQYFCKTRSSFKVGWFLSLPHPPIFVMALLSFLLLLLLTHKLISFLYVLT